MEKNIRKREIIIERAEKSDLEEIALIHKCRFSDHYLGKFSENLLKIFYNSFLIEDLFFFTARDSDTHEILGFVLGGNLDIINEMSNRFIRTHYKIYIKEIIKKPSSWLGSLVKLKKLLFQQKAHPDSLDLIMKYTLLSIAVSQKAEGKGVASKLVSSFNKRIFDMANEYFLSVKSTNNHAINFYLNRGFEKKRDFNGEVQLVQTKK